jgi:hypothetical protein
VAVTVAPVQTTVVAAEEDRSFCVAARCSSPRVAAVVVEQDRTAVAAVVAAATLARQAVMGRPVRVPSAVDRARNPMVGLAGPATHRPSLTASLARAAREALAGAVRAPA